MTHALAAALALTALLSGCASDGEPGEPSPAPSADPRLVDPSEVTGSPEPSSGDADPITYRSAGRSCVPYPGPDLLVSEEIEVGRPITIDGAELQGATHGIELGRPTYVAVPGGEVPLTGSWVGTAPAERQRGRTGWADREPLAGAEVEPGSYYVFFPIEIGGTGSYDAISLDWTDESGSGTSVWETRAVYRAQCA